MSHKKGFIFDLDGVIVDTAKYHFLAWKNLAHSIGLDFTEAQNEQLKGVSRVKSLEKILEWGNTTLSEEKFQELMIQKNNEYLSFIEDMDASEILADVPRILNLIQKEGQPIALGSASKNARIILERTQLTSKFNAIVDGNDVSIAKPDPEVFLTAAKQLQIQPEHCIVFEDSVAGIQAANAAQMISIGIGDSKTLYEADYIFTDFTQIEDNFIQELIQK